MDERVNNSICPFVRSGECDVPPCNSCFLYHLSCHEDKRSSEKIETTRNHKAIIRAVRKTH